MVVTVCGVIRPEEALAGFANPAVITVGALNSAPAFMRKLADQNDGKCTIIAK